MTCKVIVPHTTGPYVMRMKWVLVGISAVFALACGGTTDTGSTNGSPGGTTGTGGAGTSGSSGSGGGNAGGSSGSGGQGTGGNTGGASSGGASSGGASSGGAGGVGSGGAPSYGCPTTAPADGASCSGVQQTQTCTWGDSPQPSCRTSGSCESSKWKITPPPAYCSALPSTCPSSALDPSSTCTDDSLSCLYPDSTMCSCHQCVCQLNGCSFVCPYTNSGPTPVGTKVWYCGSQQPLEANCPRVIPNDGSPCNVSADVHCPQGWCGRLDVSCVEGQWHWSYPVDGCPVCASPETPIATPGGERPIASIAIGDLVYSVVGNAIVPVPVIRVGHVRVSKHHVVRVKLSSGRVLEISPGHPTADGRLFSDLHAGGKLDGERIESADVVPYDRAETYDILPASEGGTYFAAGVRIGSTLAKDSATELAVAASPRSR